MTKQEKVLNALANGDRLTAKQISARFDVANPGATINTLRMSGYPIYLDERKNSKGETVRRYRLGTASRRVIAAGYKALANGLV